MLRPSPSAADFPVDVLHLIQSFLPLFDYLRFPAVSTSWRNASRCNPRPSQSEPPSLFYFSCDSDDDDDDDGSDGGDDAGRIAVVHQFSLGKPQKIYRMRVPPPFGRRGIVTAVDHCLIVRDLDSDLKELHLLNPFSWTKIASLPSPIASLETCMDFSDLIKVVTDGDIAVAMINVHPTVLAYTRLGSDHWIDLRGITKDDSFKDAVPSRLQKGLFYAVTGACSGTIVASLEFSSSSTSSVTYRDITFNLLGDFLSKEPAYWSFTLCEFFMRLVVSSSDLYHVQWALFKRGKGIYTRKLDVYKLPLNGSAEEQKWVRVKSLGGCSFFLGNNQSISISTAEFPQVKRDCIFLPHYPFDRWPSRYDDEIEDDEYDLVYNLGDESWERLYGFDDESYRNLIWKSTWIVPRLI